MKKNFMRILAVMMCTVLCLVTNLTSLTASAAMASIPYRNYPTTGSGTFSFDIKTTTFSGYSNTSIGHFTVETQDYSSSAYITVDVKYGNTVVASAFAPTNGKLENIGFNQNFYWPAGTYTIVVCVSGTSSSGWTGVWLYH